jgi:hypothetical protein
MVEEDEPHIAVLQLWEYSRDLHSPSILFEKHSHLTICQDCIAVLWMCRGSASLDDVQMRLRALGITGN